MIVNDSEKSQKVAQLFFCDYCHYNTSKKCDYTKHLSTDKHKKRENETNETEIAVEYYTDAPVSNETSPTDFETLLCTK